MKKWVCVLTVIIIFSTAALWAQEEKGEETIFLKNGIQKIFYEFTPRTDDDRSLFKGWSDQEIKNFLEAANIMFADIHATRRMVNRYGVSQEANPQAQSLLNAGYSIETMGVAGLLAVYFVQNKLPKGTRSIASWLQALLHFNALSTHEPLSTAPNTKGDEYKITLTITF